MMSESKAGRGLRRGVLHIQGQVEVVDTVQSVCIDNTIINHGLASQGCTGALDQNITL